MKRGPQTDTGRARNGDDRSFAQKAAEAHGGAPEDWVIALAKLADQKGLRVAGETIGYSGATVSQAIAGKYPGDIGKVAEKVRGALLGETVVCPPYGLDDIIDRKKCLDWQDKPKAATSAFRVRMYRACRQCPNFRNQDKKEDSHGG